MAGMAEARLRGHRQLTELGGPGLVRREAAYWRCCGLTLPAISGRSTCAPSLAVDEAVKGSFTATTLDH